MVQYLYLDPLKIRNLNVMDCWSDPGRIVALIEGCANLEHLSVLDSALT